MIAKRRNLTKQNENGGLYVAPGIVGQTTRYGYLYPSPWLDWLLERLPEGDVQWGRWRKGGQFGRGWYDPVKWKDGNKWLTLYPRAREAHNIGRAA